MNQPKKASGIFLGLFFATGFTGLAYQVLWTKRFAAGIGHEYPAVLAVITAFMGGIAAGAWLYGRTRVLKSSTRAYGWLEILIGGWAAVSVPLIPAVNGAVIQFLGPSPDATLHWSTVFCGVFLTLLPATAAMGATFPAVERLLNPLGNSGRVGLLYAANTAGAMTGALVGAFWLMPRFGIAQSVLALAAVNVFCGIAAVAIAPREHKSSRAAQPAEQRQLAFRLAITGFLGIAFETAMIRGFSQILENTVFTYAALLAVYLGATAVGAAAQQRRPFKAAHLLFALAICCWAAAALQRTLPSLYPALRAKVGDSLLNVASAEVAAVGLVLFLPALLMGATFTALTTASLGIKPDLSWSVAWNTAGAALAPACAGLLIPLAGLNGAAALIAAGYAALIGRSKLALAAVPLLLAFPLLPSTSDLVRLRAGDRLVFHRDGALATTSVLESTNGARVLKVNNRFQMGGTAARLAEERHAYIPLLLQSAPKRALFIGLGTGITFGAAANFPTVTADGVELLPEIAQAMPLFDQADRNLSSPNLKLHIADGRRFVLASPEKYDVIVADLFHPAQDGAGFLYTREHFAAIRARLAENGLFCQWLPLFQLDLATLKIIARTFLEVFPNAEAWLLRFNVDTPVVGLLSGPPSNPAQIASSEFSQSVRRTGLIDAVRLFGCHLAGPEQLAAFAAGSALNTDNDPLVIFQAPRLAFRKSDDPGGRLLALLNELHSTNAPPWIADPELAQRVAKFKRARDLYLQALTIETRGDVMRAAALHLESAAASADFTASYAQVLTIASALAQSKPEIARALLEQLVRAQPEIPVAHQLLQRLQIGPAGSP